VLTLIFSLTPKGAEESDRIVEHTFACAWKVLEGKKVGDRDCMRRFYVILNICSPLSGMSNSVIWQIDYKRKRLNTVDHVYFVFGSRAHG
jgi:hypothetical protein